LEVNITMADVEDPQPTICETCDRAVDIRATADGVTFTHTIHDPDDHPVVAVPAPPGWSGGRCDFCSAEQPRFVLPARDFAMTDVLDVPAELAGWNYSKGDWAACEPCALLIQADRWTSLERRSAAEFEKSHGLPRTEEARTATRALHRKLRKNITGSLRPINDEGEQIMLEFGYKRGVPPSIDTAWGCRAIVEQNGYVDVLWDRVDLVGPDRARLAEHLTHHVGAAWCDSASLLLRNGVLRVDRDREFVLYKDVHVVIKGNTLGSHGYLYVCAYFHPRCPAQARGGTGTGTCGQLLDEHGQCPQASDHTEESA
jgi:hypothetical protein